MVGTPSPQGPAAPLARLLAGPIACAMLACSARAASPEDAAPLVRVAAIELPGVEGRIDHLAVDLARERLYVAALGNDTVEVVDLAAGTWTKRLTRIDEPQGVLYLAGLDRLVVSSGGAGTCEVFDGDTLKPVASVPIGPDADNLRYDARRGRVLVAYGDALGAIDASTWKALDSVRLTGAHPEGFQLDADARHAWVNVPGDRAVAVVDLESGRLATTWKLDEAGSNYPMAIVPGAPGSDEPDLCLIGCRSPARLLLRELPGGEKVAALDLSGDVDDLFWDARRRRLMAACGGGFVDVFEREGKGLGGRTRVATAPGARTSLFVPERDRLYVAAPHRGGEPARILVFAPKD